MSGAFTLPGGADRTVVMGATGTGKTTFGAWLLSRQRFDLRPWVIVDYKGEILFDKIGDPPLRYLKMGRLPKKKGLYVLQPRPDEEEAMEDWLWEVWRRENIGIFCDEVSLLPHKSAFQAILRQGRSKLIPVIACTQRPVDVERELFTESQYMSIFRLQDERDYKVVKGFTGRAPIEVPITNGQGQVSKRWSYWYDVAQHKLFTLRPVPPPDNIAAALRNTAPYTWFLGG